MGWPVRTATSGSIRSERKKTSMRGVRRLDLRSLTWAWVSGAATPSVRMDHFERVMSWHTQVTPCEKSKKSHLPCEPHALHDLADAIKQEDVGLPAMLGDEDALDRPSREEFV